MAPKTTPVALPDMRGPNLGPFRGTASADINFGRFLGSNKDLDSKVFKVRIDDKTYALKIVSTIRPFSKTPETDWLTYALFLVSIPELGVS